MTTSASVWIFYGLFCVHFFAGCITSPLAIPTIAPSTTYKIEQVNFTSPNEKSWVLMNNEIHSLVLGKKTETKDHSVLLTGMIYPVGLKKSSKEFLEFVLDQKTKNDDKDRFKILSVKNEIVAFKGVPCLKYKTLSEDHGESNLSDFKYFKTFGYVCRYPLEYLGFQFEISERSKEKEIPADLLRTAQKFFDEIQLVELTVKRLQKVP